MKSKTVVIFSKEIRRFFKDSRMVITTIIMPGLMLFALYALMGMIPASMEAGSGTVLTADAEGGSADIILSILPAAVIIFLFAGCLSMACESIAGEKERGTLATILVTPVKRGDIAAGKILALSIGAVLSGLSAAIGMAAGMAVMADNMGMNISFREYGFCDILLAAIILASGAIMIVGLISVISACARTVKEAQSYTTPLIILATAACMAVMLVNSSQCRWWMHIIPLYGSVKCLSEIIGGEIEGYGMLVTISMNLIIGIFEALILSNMLKNEKIIN